MRRFSANDEYTMLVTVAKDLEINFVGKRKAKLAAEINEKLDAMEAEVNTVEVNMFEAQDALTETEFDILTTLLAKVDRYKANLEIDKTVEEMIGSKFPTLASFMEVYGKIAGLNVIPIKLSEFDPSDLRGIPGFNK